MHEQEPAVPQVDGAPDPAPVSEWRVPRAVTLVVSGGLLAVSLLLAMLLPVPYAVQRPGPTVNTLGEHEGEPLIEVTDEETYPTSGDLRLTTVSVVGGPGYPVTSFDVLLGWFRADQLVLPVEAVFPDDATQEELDEQSNVQMASSQTNATVAALEELDYDVPMELTVSGVAQGSDAAGKVHDGDLLTSVRAPGQDRVQVGAYSQLVGVLQRTDPGTTVQLGVHREGEDLDVPVVTRRAPSGTEGSVLGIYLDPQIQVPVDVSFDIDDIGGPSAGTMFALGIIDTLTPGEMTGGEHIAGTGTMDLAGQVGIIGGIEQKLVGARRDGADWFLAPEGNCEQTEGHVPDGLRVVPVGTLAEARDAVEAIGQGDGDSLPTCAEG
ncbi:PDZ domain-containing protein [Georgenia alba]|uniref:endopeptidase La n=1 Tax=Georgenia alba TaxID=2233858 RepID=A0ABW2QB35_9MICO